jgi:hypothetical protein
MYRIMKTTHMLPIGSWVLSSLIGGTLLGACASTGTEPHDMTAGQHQAAARAEEQTAAQHKAQYDPSQTKAAANAGCVEYEGPCNVRWTSTANPTERHVKDAQKHRKMAEKHRAASQALRDAEQRFCSRIPEADRDMSPFYHREDVTAVEKATAVKDVYYGSGDQKEIGARVTLRAVPGLTGEWLQRVVDCHLARNAVVGDDPTMSFCPLGVARVTASVTSVGGGFAVDITSDNPDSVREIFKRASALGPNGPTAAK